MDAAYLPGSNTKIRVEAEINGVMHVLEGTARDVELDVKTDYTDVRSWDFNATYQDSQKTVLTAVFKDGYTWTKIEKPTAPTKFVTVTTNEFDGNQIRREFIADDFFVDEGRLCLTKDDVIIALFDAKRWFSVERTEKLVYG